LVNLSPLGDTTQEASTSVSGSEFTQKKSMQQQQKLTIKMQEIKKNIKVIKINLMKKLKNILLKVQKACSDA